MGFLFFLSSTVSLPFSSVLKFIDKQFENSRLLTEGEAVFEAKHAVVCSVKERTDEDITLVALVLQSSAINKDPHELQIAIEGREVAAASCTCKAGYGRITGVVIIFICMAEKTVVPFSLKPVCV